MGHPNKQLHSPGMTFGGMPTPHALKELRRRHKARKIAKQARKVNRT